MDDANNNTFGIELSEGVPTTTPDVSTTTAVDSTKTAVTDQDDAATRAGDQSPGATGAMPAAAAETATTGATSMAALAAYLDTQNVDVRLAGELRSAYIKSGRDDAFRRALDDGLSRIATRRRDGTPFEGRGIALLAESGAGKTQAVRRGLENHPMIGLAGVNLRESMAVSVTCLGSCTLRILGEMILEASGYIGDDGKPIKPGLRENAVWDLVRRQLDLRGVLILHVDEVSNLTDNANDSDRGRIVNNFKALINNATWPVVLVLSGIPSIGPVLTKDMQLRRRLRWLEFKPLRAPMDNATLAAFAKKLCATAGIAPMAGFAGELAPRLIHASCSQLGLAAEMSVEAVEDALRAGHGALNLENFATMFADRTGCDARHNPFVAPDWEKTDPRVALGIVQGEDGDGGGSTDGKPRPNKPFNETRRH